MSDVWQDGHVTHVCGDFAKIAQHRARGAYDVIVSWLTVLHFTERVLVFRQCYELLRPGGVMYVADMFEAGKLTAREWAVSTLMLLYTNYAPAL